MGEIGRFALSALVNAAWQFVWIALIAWGAAWLLRKSPAAQCVVWSTAFAMCCLAPLTSLPHYHGAASSLSDVARPVWLYVIRKDHSPAPLSPDSFWGKAVLSIYLCTVLWYLARLARSYWLAKRQAANSYRVELTSEVASQIATFETELGITAPELRLSARAPVPFTYGIRQPVVVLPEWLLRSGSNDIILSALGHEIAHIRRRDFAWNGLLELVFPLVAFHPCAHWVRRRIRAARELASDDIVAARLLDRTMYAESLLSLALQSAASSPSPDRDFRADHSGDLEHRIRRQMIAGSNQRPRMAWRLAICGMLLVGAVGAGVSYSFEPADPKDYAGIWRQNWASAFRADLVVNRNECCFRTLEIRYQDGRFQGAMTSDSAAVIGNRVVRGSRQTRPVEYPRLENGVLSFQQKIGRTAETYEVTLAPDGSALIRSRSVDPPVGVWAAYGRLR